MKVRFNDYPVYKRVLIPTAVIVFLGTMCLFNVKAQKSSLRQTGIDIESKIGSMIMVGFRGTALNESQHISRDLKKYRLGGVILFDYDVPTKSNRRNILSPQQLRSLTTSLQNHTENTLLIAIDQEGGTVSRLKPKRGFAKTVSAEKLGEIDDVDSTRIYTEQAAGQLAELGFNVNFAPVLDLNTNPDNPVIGALGRSISADAEEVTRHASVMLETFERYGIIGVGKHFPGHGSSEDDSHLGVVEVTKTWQTEELKPYKNLTEDEQLQAVMTAHIYNAKLDSLWPATLSQKIITGKLREEMGFEGVVFSDDLQMEAIRSEYSLEQTIYRSLKAGVDILLFANNSIYEPDIVPKTVEIIKKLLAEGRITKERINKSYLRIQQLKQELRK